MSDFPKLFIPGPTHVPDDILKSLSSPQIGHRTPEMSELVNYLKKGIEKVLYTNNHIYLISHAATGLWEMGSKNSVNKGILHAVNGAFSSKWALSSELSGIKTQRMETDWGNGIDVDQIDKCLSSGEYDVFAMVHNETSTGAMSDLLPISNLLKQKYPDIIWLVDAVSSMAGVKIEVDKLNIDFLFSSTQKAWGLPAGFSICSVSERLLNKSLSINNKGYFLDLHTYEKYYLKNQTPTTPSIPHMFGLKYMLQKINSEGLENRWRRHIDMANCVRDWSNNKGQSFFTNENSLSHTLTCITNKQNWDIDKVNGLLLERGYRMDRGYGEYRCKTFRIPHMGNIYMKDLIDYLNNFDEVLCQLKY